MESRYPVPVYPFLISTIGSDFSKTVFCCTLHEMPASRELSSILQVHSISVLQRIELQHGYVFFRGFERKQFSH